MRMKVLIRHQILLDTLLRLGVETEHAELRERYEQGCYTPHIIKCISAFRSGSSTRIP